MAKKQLKKLNQPKKYLQGGSNMGSVSMMRQNPYYIGQVNQNAAEEDLANAQEQLMQTRQSAAQAKKDAKEQQQAEMDQTFQQSASILGQAAIADKKAGILGKFWVPGTAASSGIVAPTLQSSIAANSANAVANTGVSTVTGIGGAPILSSVGKGTAGAINIGKTGLGGAPIISNTATNAGTTIAENAGSTAAGGMSALTSGLIGVAGNIAGTVIKNKTNDNSDFTATNKEATGNIVGSGVKSAATGFVLGNMFVPGVGGAIGAGIGAGIGAIKARKENKAAEEEAKRLQRELAAQRGAYQSAFVNSHLTSGDTGFGLNSSTNENNQFTNQYQVAKTGGVTGIQEDRRTKYIPGGKIVPIEGTDAVEYIGKSHAEGGMFPEAKKQGGKLNKGNIEVEGGETEDQVIMNDNSKQEYIFSKYLKLGGKSFAQRHKEILKGGGSQAEIQQLAAMQEKVAGRNPQQVAAYGGFHKYLDGGVKPCPECPPNTVCNPATGECVADEETNNSYDWNATGLEGFKAKQNAAAPVKKEPAKPAGPTLYYNNDTKKYTYRDENGKELMSGYDQNRLANQMNAQRPGATGFDQQLANIEKRETPGVKPSTDNQTAVATQNGKSNAPADATAKVTYPPFGDPVENFRKNRDAQNAENSAKYGTYVDKSLVTANSTKTGKEALEDAMERSALDDKIREGKQFLNAVTDIASLDAAYDANKITLGEYRAKRKELEAAAPKPAPTATVNTGQQPTNQTNSSATTTSNAGTPPIDQEEQDWRNHWISQGYIFNDAGERVLPPGKKLVVHDDGTEEIVDDTPAPATSGTAAYTAPTGVTPPSATNPPAATANTGTTTPPTATTDDGFAAPAKRATSTSTTTGTPQTPEEKEAARLAGLPRLFMGASRKVDEATGEVTAYTDKPLMGVGDMAGSRLGTTNNSTEELGKVTNNAYDQAWNNKADNLYTNQKGAGSGALSFSDYVKDRDKIAESNWGKKYGYTKGMSEKDAKAAHGRFEADVHSLFANNPDEMMGYFQYIIDGGDPNTKEDAKNKKPGTYLGKDAEQIRANLKNKGYIDANGQPIAGKKVDGKTMAQYLEEQATNNAVGPIHNALGSYTAERSATKIKLKEEEKKKEEIVQEIPKKYEPCPPGTYRSGDGTCKPVGDIPQASRISGALVAGLGQLIPVGAALANPYKIAPGIMGAAAVKGALMPRVNMNQERASNIQQNVAYKNAVINQNAGPGALAAMQMANTKTNEQMLKIAQQEQNQNRQLAAEEGKLGMQASMFNAENNLKTQMFNKEFNQKERQYRREDILGALDTAAARVAGIFKDDRSYKAQERLATALDETGSYDRFSILEQLNKDAKRKGSPYYGTTETERRRIAAAMHKELNPEGYVGMSEYNKLQEEKAKLQKEKEELEKAGKAKFGGARQYVSRLGELQGVRATKAKL